MENDVGREGEVKDWGKLDCPPAAKSYYLRVLSQRNAGTGFRNLREMRTLCTLLDHLALGRLAEAADVVTQRLKAVDMAAVEQNWARTSYLELVPEDAVTMASRGEQKMVQSEMEAHRPARVSSFSNENSEIF